MAEVFTAVLSGAEGFERLVVIKRSSRAGAEPRRRRAVHRRGQAGLACSCTRTSCPCSTSARSATGTSWPRSTSSAGPRPRSPRCHSRSTGARCRPALVFYIAHEALAALAYAHERTDDERPAAGASSTATSRRPTSWSARRRGEAARLRHREGRRSACRSTARGQRQGQRRLHVARAGARPRGRAALGSLLARAGDVRLLAGEPFYQGAATGEILFKAATGPSAEELARIDRAAPPAARDPERRPDRRAADRYPSARAFGAGRRTVGEHRQGPALRNDADPLATAPASRSQCGSIAGRRYARGTGPARAGALPTGSFSGPAAIGGSPRNRSASPWSAEKAPAGPFPLLSPVPHAPRRRQPDAIVWTAAPAGQSPFDGIAHAHRRRRVSGAGGAEGGAPDEAVFLGNPW